MSVENNKKTDFKIIIKGQLGVNLPVILIILLFWYILFSKFNLDYRLSGRIGCGAGWLLWEILIRKWIVWCLSNNIEHPMSRICNPGPLIL